jgi:hypothetical protein
MSVRSLSRDHVAHASARLFNIAPAAGYQVQVAMPNRLTSHLTTICTNVEPLNRWIKPK